MPFAVDSASNFEVVFIQYYTTFYTSEAAPMVFLDDGTTRARDGFQKFTLDASMASMTNRTILLMIMLFTVGLVIDDVEVGCFEG